MKTQKIIEDNFPQTESLTPEEYIKLTKVLGIEVEAADIILSPTGKIQIKGNYHRQLLKILN